MNNVDFRGRYPSVQEKRQFFHKKQQQDLISQPNETGQVLLRGCILQLATRNSILSSGMLLVTPVVPFIIIIIIILFYYKEISTGKGCSFLLPTVQVESSHERYP